MHLKILLFIFFYLFLYIISFKSYDIYNQLLQYVKSKKKITIYNKGQMLLNLMGQFRPELGINQNNSDRFLSINYKGIENIIVELLNLHKKYGISLNDPWRGIKDGLIMDLRFQKKRDIQARDSKIEVLFMIIFIWVFVISFSYLSPSILPLSVYLVLFLIHALSFFIFNKIKVKILDKESLYVQDLMMSLIKLRNLSKIGIPIDDVIKISKLYDMEEEAISKDFNLIKTNIDYIINNWKKNGYPIEESIQALISEMWFIIECNFEKSSKKLKGLALFISFTFILPSFFLVLGVSFGQLLI